MAFATAEFSWLRASGGVTIMGILNATPDSFSDGGLFMGPTYAVRRAADLVAAGADIIDVGGESTRPGAQAVSQSEELARVVPVIEAIRARFPIPISIDTSDPTVMRAAVSAGANIINDVRALSRPGALAAAAELAVPICLTHSQGEPATMQDNPTYGDVVCEVRAFLAARIAACVQAGIDRGSLAIDPGFGFGKTLAHNRILLQELAQLADLGPLMVGVSRKAMTGTPFGLSVSDRLHTSIALALAGVRNGARIVRVHDVRAMREALWAWEWVFSPKERNT